MSASFKFSKKFELFKSTRNLQMLLAWNMIPRVPTLAPRALVPLDQRSKNKPTLPFRFYWGIRIYAHAWNGCQTLILDPRALLFCAWQTARRALGNPWTKLFVICCWLKQRKRVWLVNLRRGKMWTCLAKVVPPSWEFYVCFLCKSQIEHAIVTCAVFGGFEF